MKIGMKKVFDEVVKIKLDKLKGKVEYFKKNARTGNGAVLAISRRLRRGQR